MDTPAPPWTNWDDLRLALAVARHGTLSAAARALRTTQPTISRRLAALERAVGVRLFERTATGLSPTPLCRSLLDGLEAMDQGALSIERRIAARDTALQGRVAVTSIDWLGDYVVAPMLARFGALHASIDLELVNEGRVFNLARGEADLAFRFGPFAQENLVERKVADVRFGLYASVEYLARHGPPDFAQGCAGHAVVTLHRDGGNAPDVDWLRRLAPAARVVLRANGISAHLAAVESGEALAVLPRVVAGGRAALQRLETPVPEPVRAMRLGVHAELRKAPRVRALIDFAVQDLAQRAGVLNPP